MTLALTRRPSPALARCELTFLTREGIDAELAARQHAAYESALESLGCRIVRLPEEPDLPDAVFVEDTALVLDELAVLTRPGAASRRPESASVEKALAPLRPLARIAPPGTLDGGDVLRLGRRVLVGRSSRSDADAVRQLADLLRPHGYRVEAAPLVGCLHLKSAATQVAEDAVLLNPGWVSPDVFPSLRRIEVHPDEAHAANALLVAGTAIFPTAFPRTAERLERAGVRLLRVDVSELAKAEGAVTCCSLILREA